MRLILSFLILTVSLCSFGQKTITVVIDPGHGGKDPGHESKNPNHLSEKDLNLKIALFFGEYIEKYLQNVNVIYTRKTDIYPTLDERVATANKHNADYFISIHCNGNTSVQIKGTESHVHSFANTKSVSLAREIETQFSTRAGRHSRGVKDGNDRAHSIQVLKFTQMTSVLVECGFLTNVSEANFLNTTNGQEIIASAIFRGFRTFIQKQHPTISFVKSEKSTKKGNYTIQIMSSIDPIDTKSSQFKKLSEDVERVELNTTNAYKYKYFVGKYATKSDAQNALKAIQNAGFKDAFVTQRE